MLSLTASLLASTPKVRDLQQAFLWYALEARQYSAVKPWIDPEDPNFNEQRTLLLAVLANFIQTHPRDDLTGLIEALYPGGNGSVSAFWDSARVFAACGRYGPAIVLGKLAFGRIVLGRCQMANEIARWLIDSDETAEAREILAIAIQGPAEKLDEDFVSSLQALYELSTEDQRVALFDAFLPGGDRVSAPNRDALAAACLLGWGGRYARAERCLMQVFQQPAWAGDNTLSAIDDVGRRTYQFADQIARLLLTHKLQPLARFVWEKIVADRAFARLQTNESREAIDGFKIKLAELDLNVAKPSQAAGILDGIREGDVRFIGRPSGACRADGDETTVSPCFRSSMAGFMRTRRRVQANFELSRK